MESLPVTQQPSLSDEESTAESAAGFGGTSGGIQMHSTPIMLE